MQICPIIVLQPVMGIRLFQENGSLSISPEDLILLFSSKERQVNIQINIPRQGTVFTTEL
jgi:hypothetical protein